MSKVGDKDEIFLVGYEDVVSALHMIFGLLICTQLQL